jgi:hypothetical protein
MVRETQWEDGEGDTVGGLVRETQWEDGEGDPVGGW